MSKPLFEVKGFKELRRKLERFPDKVKKREVVKILRRAARDTVQEARRQAPQSDKPHVLKDGKVIQPGNTKKSIKFQTLRRSKNPGGIVGPRSLGKNDGFYARQFVIPGHNLYRKGFKRNRRGNRKRNSSGSRGRVPANPFMLRAYNVTKGRVSAASEKGVSDYIAKQLTRL